MLLVRFFDYIGEKTGRGFGIIFKIIIPFLVTFIPIDQVCAWTTGPYARMFDIILWIGFLCLLIWLPRIASVTEFVIIGLALVLTIGLGTIDHAWGWAVMIASAVFLFFKLLSLLAIMIKKADAMQTGDKG